RRVGGARPVGGPAPAPVRRTAVRGLRDRAAGRGGGAAGRAGRRLGAGVQPGARGGPARRAGGRADRRAAGDARPAAGPGHRHRTDAGVHPERARAGRRGGAGRAGRPPGAAGGRGARPGGGGGGAVPEPRGNRADRPGTGTAGAGDGRAGVTPGAAVSPDASLTPSPHRSAAVPTGTGENGPSGPPGGGKRTPAEGRGQRTGFSAAPFGHAGRPFSRSAPSPCRSEAGTARSERAQAGRNEVITSLVRTVDPLYNILQGPNRARTGSEIRKQVVGPWGSGRPRSASARSCGWRAPPARST